MAPFGVAAKEREGKVCFYSLYNMCRLYGGGEKGEKASRGETMQSKGEGRRGEKRGMLILSTVKRKEKRSRRLTFY